MLRTSSINLVSSILASALVAAGCGSPSAENVADDFAATVCNFGFDCCSRGEIDFFWGPYVTEDDCEARLINSAQVGSGVGITLPGMANVGLLLPNLGELQNAIDDGRTEVDGDALDACLAYIKEQGCNEFVAVDPELGCVPPPPPVETPCETELMFNGKIEENGPCSSPGFGFECEDGLICRNLGLFGVFGACVRPGVEGDFCFSDSECHEDFYCSQSNGRCTVFSQKDEPCAFSDPDDPSPSASTQLIKCDPSLSCDPVTDRCVEACQRGASCSTVADCDQEQMLQCIDGRCDLPRGEGLPCNSDLHCTMGLRCAQSLVNPGELECQEKLPNGTPCDTGGINDDDCASGYCDTTNDFCTATSAEGGLCPSGRDQQCAAGWCENTIVLCNADDQCLGSGSCNLLNGRCQPYCVADIPDGGQCTRGAQCESTACVDLFCRTLPLADGEACSADFQCESLFCSFDNPRVCATPPLENGRGCGGDDECISGICFSSGGESRCNSGLGEGDACDDPFNNPPCGADLFCDTSLQPATCVKVFEPGEDCEGSFQCRDQCVLKFARNMCNATPAIEAAVCDGPDPAPSE